VCFVVCCRAESWDFRAMDYRTISFEFVKNVDYSRVCMNKIL
jgi:hypothetical protein